MDYETKFSRFWHINASDLERELIKIKTTEDFIEFLNETKKIISELKRRLARIHQIPIPDRYEMHLVAVNLGLVYENLASVIEAYQDYLNAKENKDFHFKFYQQMKEMALQTIRFPLELIEQLSPKILDEIKSIAKELDVLENAINSELDNIDLDSYFSKLYSNLENDLMDDTYLN
jgi:hypothetical protein